MIPIGDSPKSRTTPWVTYMFILLNVAVFAGMLGLDNSPPETRAAAQREFRDQTNAECYGFETLPSAADRFVCRWATQPKEFVDNFRGVSDVPRPDRPLILISIVTAMFLHGGWLHILGNLLFLWVFGDNVEDRLGHFGYLLFYIAAGIVASLVQIAADPQSVTPILGASGAVAGVLGAYLVLYPRATVRAIIPFFILIFIPLPIPAWVMIGLWFLQNLAAGYATIVSSANPDAGVAWFAHIGGFLFGAVLVAFFVRWRGHQLPPGGAKRLPG
ncbi:MAG: rhomboid family intramembrane serine protease [Tepidiformaceae bacterium]